MDEHQWMTSTDPQAMLTFLRDSGHLSERKARLFAVACCRGIWPLLGDERSRKAAEMAEQYADRLVGSSELAVAASFAERAAQVASNVLAGTQYPGADWLPALISCEAALAARFASAFEEYGEEVCGEDIAANTVWHARVAAREAGLEDLLWLFHCIFPLPFRPLPPLDPGVLAWQEATLVRLAQAAYEERELPSGHLDSLRLRVLADALEEAGCADQDILGHLRGPGPHVRGCFIVDLLLSKE